jgi:hypothetical protein
VELPLALVPEEGPVLAAPAVLAPAPVDVVLPELFPALAVPPSEVLMPMLGPDMPLPGADMLGPTFPTETPVGLVAHPVA